MVANGEMSETFRAALDAIDDPVALVDGRPVAVDSLWRDTLRSLDCGHREGVLVVHPSWWPASRVGVVTAAAKTLADDVLARPRSWLLTRASPDAAPETPPENKVVVEIAERLVVVSGAPPHHQVAAVPRRTEPHLLVELAEEVAGAIAPMTRGTTAVVLIDAPSTVCGAPALATLIAGAVRDGGSGPTVVKIDDTRLPRAARLALKALSAHGAASEPAAGAGGVRSLDRRLAGLAAAGVMLVLAVPAVAAVGRHGVSAAEKVPTTFLVEGRVALTVPANWPTQRVISGPGSARVQATSPSDPEVALHITQSPVPGETLSGTAEWLKRAIDAEPAGVFVDFNPSSISAGRPAVTYREVRARHHVRWTVLLDGAVRISVGCQSRPGAEDAVRDVCEQAVRSAHAVG
jgi:type VII secretion-associated protein (TIGR03931 family)